MAQRAPVFCVYPHEPPALPDVPSLTIQELRDFANKRLDSYCSLLDQYRECLRLVTGGSTIVGREDQCN